MGSDRVAERQLALLIALMHTEHRLTKATIRATVAGYDHASSDAAFNRMFERDKNQLRDLGVPIVTVLDSTYGDDVGYRIDTESYSMPDISFTAAELAVLSAAAELWRDASLRAPATRGLTKLRAVEPDQEPPPGHRIMPNDPLTLHMETGGETMAVFLEAIAARNPVTFTYRAATTSTSAPRHLNTWRLTLKYGHWYALGYDLDREAPRAFRLSRIVGRPKLMRQTTGYDIPDTIDIDAMIRPGTQRIEATLALLPGRGNQLRAAATDHPGRDDDFDRDLITVKHHDHARLAEEISGLGAAAIVVSPKTLREAVISSHGAVASATLPPSAANLTAGDADAPQHHPASGSRLRAVGGTDIDANADPSASPAAAVEPTSDRIVRLLALLEYLRHHDDVPSTELADHFGISESQLLADIDLLWVSGTPGYMPDDLIDFNADSFAGGRITLREDRGMARPLRLAPHEAITLLAALAPLSALAEDKSTTEIITTTKAKLVDAAGPSVSQTLVDAAVHVDLDPPDEQKTSRIREALRRKRRLHLKYVSSADKVTERHVDPIAFESDGGRWVLHAWCHLAQAGRTFRVDRMLDVHMTDDDADMAERHLITSGLGHSGESVTIAVDKAALWFVEQIPTTSVTETEEAYLVDLYVGSEAWFISALLSLGSAYRGTTSPRWHQRISDAANQALSADEAFHRRR